MSSYPRWKYHATAKPKVFNNAQEELAGGADWYDSPTDIPSKESPVVERVEEKEVKKSKKK